MGAGVFIAWHDHTTTTSHTACRLQTAYLIACVLGAAGPSSLAVRSTFIPRNIGKAQFV